ncbi:MAG TPA: hypothetical protein VGM53_14660 [Streptosporangiaceae bacterium]|jgi:hypothetical protein
MDSIQTPTTLPPTITRPRGLVDAVMSASLHEQGSASRTASAWRWALTGHGPSPVSDAPGNGQPPGGGAITAEAGHRANLGRGYPPWREDGNPDRQQARRVLRWLTGAADAIPLLDPGRGRYVGARFHLARTDTQLRQVRYWAYTGLAEHGNLPEQIPRWKAERPWQWPAWWMNAAWLNGTIAYLDWILGDSDFAPLSGHSLLLDPVTTLARIDSRDLAAFQRMYGIQCGAPDIEDEISGYVSSVTMQGHEGQPTAEPDEKPPPQWGEGVEQAHDWATGEDAKPPADHHGCGDYHPCPDVLRCLCETAGHCLRGQCPACTDRICNAAWTSIEENY